MAVSKAQQKAVAKYNAKAYDRIELKVAKGKKDVIKDAAQKQGESLNSFINNAINEKLERDTVKDVATDNDIEAVRAARQEYANGETVNHNAINWD